MGGQRDGSQPGGDYGHVTLLAVTMVTKLCATRKPPATVGLRFYRWY
jgi:hypothetical protein